MRNFWEKFCMRWDYACQEILRRHRSLIGFVVFMNLTVGGFATEYFVEFWGAHFKGVPVDIPFWQAAIAGFFFGELLIPLSALTWVFTQYLT